MTTGTGSDALVQVFGARLAAFHATLSSEEQRLLEALVLLADQSSAQDTGGFAFPPISSGGSYDPWAQAPGVARLLARIAAT